MIQMKIQATMSDGKIYVSLSDMIQLLQQGQEEVKHLPEVLYALQQLELSLLNLGINVYDSIM
jgi:hypothetical protein